MPTHMHPSVYLDTYRRLDTCTRELPHAQSFAQ